MVIRVKGREKMPKNTKIYFCKLFETELKNVLNFGVFCRHCDLEDIDMELARTCGLKQCKHFVIIPL